MEKEFEKMYHQVEKAHWWALGRRQYIIQLLKKYPPNSKILDIGCSSGILLNDLFNSGFKKENLYGVDISQEAIKNCKKNGINQTFVMDAQEIDLPEKKFDIIIASDCLEHVPNDHKALQNWKTLLKQDGTLFIFVPAFMVLWSQHDEKNMHYRRYTNKELKTKLLHEDFFIRGYGYWNFFLFIPALFFRLLSRFKNSKTHANSKNIDENDSEGKINISNQWINQALIILLNIENFILRFVRFPFGVSTFCVAGINPIKR